MSQTQQQMRTLVSRKGQRCETPHTDAEAFEKLAVIAEQTGNSFATDLVVKGRRNGLSEEQFFWVHKLVADHENPPKLILYPEIASAYRRGRDAGVSQRNMKYQIGYAGDQVVQLAIAGPRSKNAGCVWVTLPDTDTYCGKIGLDNCFYRSKTCGDDVVEVLNKLEENVGAMLPW